MPQKRHFNKKSKPHHRNAPERMLTPLAAQPEKKIPVVYGKPFTLLEDEQKKTFEFKAGSWIPYLMSIAECRQTCQVNELPQKVNRMTRYEIRCPVAPHS
jgi:hypothetical protein